MPNAELDRLAQPAQPTADQTVKIDVTVNELNVIFGALQELPHRVADPVLKKVFNQAQAQLGQPAQQ